MLFREISSCRICGNQELVSILNLGSQSLTGVFPRTAGEDVPSAPLELVKCSGEGSRACGLVQLRHSCSADAMYGDNYGYRSGLNAEMAAHLKRRVETVTNYVSLNRGDLVIDIGSNDGTLLGHYLDGMGLRLAGIDPTAAKFRQYYREGIEVIPEFFNAETVRRHFGQKKAKVVTSLSMFYDLEAPLEFMQEIREVLAPDGVWFLEQSYLPTMLEANSYDTVCHEHLEYYALRQIKWMAERAGFRILDVDFNGVNGGSFGVMLARTSSAGRIDSGHVSAILKREKELGLDGEEPYKEFARRIEQHREELLRKLEEIRASGGVVAGYGASTKGNVLLQYCGLSGADLPCIAEVNTEKFGCFTPGTRIPIVSEQEAKAMNPACFLVLPWHFRKTIIRREDEYLRKGGALLFPLPRLEMVTAGHPEAIEEQVPAVGRSAS